MSAWIVSKAHIDVLTNALVQNGLVEPVQMNEVGQMLWKENHRSVNVRYGEQTRTPRYSAQTTEAEILPVHIIAAVHCYEYQSCEHDGWETSVARDLTLSLETKVTSEHPEAKDLYNHGSQFSDYRWGYASLDEATVVGVPS